VYDTTIIPVLAASLKARIEEGREAIRLVPRAFENPTGYWSLQRIAQEDALLRIKAARSCAALHASLAGVGITYEPAGTNGVVFGIGAERVKALIVDRSIKRKRLEEPLGVFQTRDPKLGECGS
jgi:hypothetical protein